MGCAFRGIHPQTIGTRYNKHVLDNSIKHIRASVPKIILKPVCHVVGSIPRERSTAPTSLAACSRSSDLSLLLFSLPNSLRISDFQDFEHRIANHSSGTVQDSHLLPFTECGAKVHKISELYNIGIKKIVFLLIFSFF